MPELGSPFDAHHICIQQIKYYIMWKCSPKSQTIITFLTSRMYCICFGWCKFHFSVFVSFRYFRPLRSCIIQKEYEFHFAIFSLLWASRRNSQQQQPFSWYSTIACSHWWLSCLFFVENNQCNQSNWELYRQQSRTNNSQQLAFFWLTKAAEYYGVTSLPVFFYCIMTKPF